MTSQPQSKQSYVKPLENIWYRAYNTSTQEQTSFDSGRLKVNISNNAKFTELNFTTYQNFNNSNPNCMQWFEDAPSGSIVNYTINLTDVSQSFISDLKLRKWNESTSSWDIIQSLDASDGWANFSTTEHSTNELQILGDAPPQFSNINPPDGATHITRSPTLSVQLNETKGQPMNYSIELQNLTDSKSGNEVSNGTYELSLSDLGYRKTYTWYVNATDGISWNNESFTFTTLDHIPSAVPDEIPSDGSDSVSLGYNYSHTSKPFSPVGIGQNAELSVDVFDDDGDSMNVSFYDASDDSLIGEKTSLPNGTVSIIWNNLNYDQTYNWYAVVEDSTDSITTDTFSFTPTDRIKISTTKPSTNRTNESVTKGSAGTVDELPDDNLDNVSTVYQSGTTYQKTTDYLVNHEKGQIDWSPSGSEPASGTTYYVNYTYNISVASTSNFNFSSLQSDWSTGDVVKMRWSETALSNATIKYSINTGISTTLFKIERYNSTESAFEPYKENISNDAGILNFTTLDHSTNEYRIIIGEKPVVNYTVPADQSTSINRDKNIKIVFSQTMNTSHIPTLTDNYNTTYTFDHWESTNYANDTAVFTHPTYDQTTNYTLTVSDYKGENGVIGDNYTWTFRTESYGETMTESSLTVLFVIPIIFIILIVIRYLMKNLSMDSGGGSNYN